jgi:alpha-N-acetylglucosaminidase
LRSVADVGLAGSYLLDSRDPLFAEINGAFIKLVNQYLGTDHVYNADTFNGAWS